MRTAYWDSGEPEMYFDNPNLRWGDPAYLLEPGDPGYATALSLAAGQATAAAAGCGWLKSMPADSPG
jgi:hypothetical protein